MRGWVKAARTGWTLACAAIVTAGALTLAWPQAGQSCRSPAAMLASFSKRCPCGHR